MKRCLSASVKKARQLLTLLLLSTLFMGCQSLTMQKAPCNPLSITEVLIGTSDGQPQTNGTLKILFKSRCRIIDPTTIGSIVEMMQKPSLLDDSEFVSMAGTFVELALLDQASNIVWFISIGNDGQTVSITQNQPFFMNTTYLSAELSSFIEEIIQEDYPDRFERELKVRSHIAKEHAQRMASSGGLPIWSWEEVAPRVYLQKFRNLEAWLNNNQF